MLLNRLEIDATQEEIAEAGGATNLIDMNGMRVDQLALAVHRLGPRLSFYYKEHTTIAELVRVVNDYYTPAGVEWQGVFEDGEDEEDEDYPEEVRVDHEGEFLRAMDGESEDSDYGHYSLVIRADRRRRHLVIMDPYKDYFSQARVFSFDEFDQRWYDYNEVPDPASSEAVLLKDDHLMFVVVPRNVSYPRRMGMQAYSW